MDADRFHRAMDLAIAAHRTQIRKGSANLQRVELPYITHVVTVATAVQFYDGSEDQVIAGLLHDALEDGGEVFREPIRALGEPVLQMVLDCSDVVVADAAAVKPPWQARKEQYLAKLAAKCAAAAAGLPDPAILVSACDKLANLQALRQDHRKVGDLLFCRFSATKDQTLWYYQELVKAYRGAVPALLWRALNQELYGLLADVG